MAGVVVAVLLALGYSLQSQPVYLAAADVLIEPTGADVQAGTKLSSDEVATQTQVVTSLPVARLVQEQRGLAETPDLSDLVTVQPLGVSRILRVTAQDSSPERAAETANTVAAAYLQFRESESIGRYEETRKRLQQEQDSLAGEIDKLDREADGTPTPAQRSERRKLLAEQAQITTQLDSLQSTLTTATAGGALLRAASAPDDPVSPQTELNVLLGALFGLLIGVVVALLRERFDDVVHEEETVRQSVGHVMLGKVSRWGDGSARTLATLADPHGTTSEEYQRVGANVRFMMATARPDDDASATRVLVTSAQHGEGRTTTVCNLAVAMARLGLDVALVDADFRDPGVAARFGLGSPPGLSDLLVGQASAPSLLVDVDVPHLRVLATGESPPNPAALLSSVRMLQILDELAHGSDVVLMDGPPMLTVADSLELANLADLVVVVTREGVSHRRQLAALAEALTRVGAEAVGVVVNGASEASPQTPRSRGHDGSGSTRKGRKHEKRQDQQQEERPVPSDDSPAGSPAGSHAATPLASTAGDGEGRGSQLPGIRGTGT